MESDYNTAETLYTLYVPKALKKPKGIARPSFYTLVSTDFSLYMRQ